MSRCRSARCPITGNMNAMAYVSWWRVSCCLQPHSRLVGYGSTPSSIRLPRVHTAHCRRARNGGSRFWVAYPTEVHGGESAANNATSAPRYYFTPRVGAPSSCGYSRSRPSLPRYHDFYFPNRNLPLATTRRATNSSARSNSRRVLAIRANCRPRSVCEVS
jgi:hypothetical protein